MNTRRILEIGGIAAGFVMIAFGIGSLALGINARQTVGDELKREFIVGSPDMSPAETEKAVAEAGLSDVTIPSCDVAEKAIKTGSDARCFAQYMRIHALESSDGNTYAQMGRFVAAANPDDPKGTSDEAAAAKDEDGEPISNGARNTWVTETALCDCAQRLLHGGADRAVQRRGRDRVATQRYRLRHPRTSPFSEEAAASPQPRERIHVRNTSRQSRSLARV